MDYYSTPRVSSPSFVSCVERLWPRLAVFALLLGLALPGCGSDGGGGGGPDADTTNAIGCDGSERYWALTEGATWTLKVTDPSDVTKNSTKTQTVGALEAVAGKTGVMAYKLTTVKGGGGMVTSWQEDTGDAIHRHREEDRAGVNTSDELYEPYKLRIDESAARAMVGASWTENYDEVITDTSGGTGTMTQAKTEAWSVEAVDEIVTVPAGVFCAMRVRKISTANTGGSDKQYWFVRGVGKVKELSATQLEELTSYSIP